MTLQYIADRAKFLGWKDQAGIQNIAQLGEQLGMGKCEFKNADTLIAANDSCWGQAA